MFFSQWKVSLNIYRKEPKKSVLFILIHIFFCAEMLSQQTPEQQKQTGMQSVSTFEESSTGIESKREKTEPDYTENQSVDLLAKDCVNYCKSNGIENPAEILHYAQSPIVTGRPLDVQDVTVNLEGETNFILINRQDVLRSAMEEVQFLKDPRLTLAVGFYGESAEDYGGPRKEFFRLCLREIKAKYFDNGLKDHLSNDYSTIGLIMVLSTLQNGSIPRFLKEDHLQALFSSGEPSNPCISKLRFGFKTLGLYQIGNGIPNFLHLFRPSESSALSRRKLIVLLPPNFSEGGSNVHRFESEIYDLFSKYTRLAASGQRGSITLGHILQFVTGTDEEPPLGFGVAPCIEFVEAASHGTNSHTECPFLPTANTCANILYLPRRAKDVLLPSEEQLFNLYDLAFANAFFGNL